MRNPWLIIACCISLFVLFFFFLYRSSEPTRSVLEHWHIDKLFHLAGGYLLVAFGIWLLDIRDIGILFLFVVTVGAGWEVCQYLSDYRGFSLRYSSYILGGLEPFADLAADIAGAVLYWLLHMRVN